jgi:NitT/TauT family transport system permease protein
MATLFWLALWQVAAAAIGQEILLVSPVRVLARVAYLAGTDDFSGILFASMLRILSGFFFAVALGVALAVLTARSAFFRHLFAPLRALIKATPVASFILLALVWIHTDAVPAFISFLMVLPTVWGNVEQGIWQTDAQLLEMAKAYRFKTAKKLRLIYIPSVLPYFLSAFSSGLGLGFKSAIAAEVICLPKRSIGVNMYYAKIYLETPDLLAWTVILVALSILFEWGLVHGARALIRKNGIGLAGATT